MYWHLTGVYEYAVVLSALVIVGYVDFSAFYMLHHQIVTGFSQGKPASAVRVKVCSLLHEPAVKCLVPGLFVDRTIH